MDERLLTRLREAGFAGDVTNSLVHGDLGAAFALSDATLAFVDAAGARQVALRDINRIHSDREGVLRVETADGTAITASLLGFDPSGVQGFFNEVRIATNAAKHLPQTPTPVAQSPWKSGWQNPASVAPPQEAGAVDADGPVAGPPPPVTPPAASVSSPLPEAAPSDPVESVTVLPSPAATNSQTPPAEPRTPAPRPVVISTTPRYTPTPTTPRPTPSTATPTEPRQPPRPTAPKVETSAPVPATPSREIPMPDHLPVRNPALLALADSVERLSGTLRLLAVAMGLAAILVGILRFRDGDAVTGLWIVGSGVVAAFAIVVFAQVARLMVGVARQMNPEA